MALFRNVNMSFWTDTKVIDDYTPEDRYFMLYALTNNYTNIIGCYEIGIKQISNDLGYTKDVVENLLKRFKEIHKTIDYDFDTKELYVRNWYKYNWNISPKLNIPLSNAIEKVKSDKFHDYLAEIYNARESVIAEADTLSIPYRYGIKKNGYPIDTTNSNSNSNSNRNSIEIDNICSFKNEQDKPLSKKQIEEMFNKEFEEVWKQYPNKKGKANALKSYIKARKKGITKEDITNGLNNYLDYIKAEKIESQFIKHGSTWFNQECWNDEYKENNKTTKTERRIF